MTEMTAAEALNALKPLTTMFRAVQRLEDLLTYAHSVEGVLPEIEQQIKNAREEMVASKETTAKSMDRDRQRMADATRKADEVVAAEAARVEAAERAAAERCKQVEQQTAAKLAQLAEQVTRSEARLAAVRKNEAEAEAKLAAARKLQAEALKALGGGA